MSENRKGPLHGVRVFDSTLLMVGPWCSMQLGALGADVIHVESPEFAGGRSGGLMRAGGGGRVAVENAKNPQTFPLAGVPPSMFGTSIGYMMWNLNKRGVVLDFKNPEDLEFTYELLKTCDVLVQNMRPGVMTRLGLGYERLREINPGLIYCSISGWGQRGPMAALSGADNFIQTGSGWTSITGASPEAWEGYRHVTQLDANTGNHAAQAIIAALLARERTGQGQHIEVSMLEAALSLQTSRVAEFIATGAAPLPLGAALPAVVPEDAFLCEDGEYVALSARTEAQWRAVCLAIDLPELAEDRSLASNAGRVAGRERVTAAFAERLATKPVYWWVHLLNRAGVAASRIMRFDELRYHPQVTENSFVSHVQTKHWGPVYAGGAPWHFSETPERMIEPPYPGDHDAEVRADVRRGTFRAEESATRAHGHNLTAERPLEGYLVVDISQGLAGPHATMLLADAGARVVKVEPPEGDYQRGLGPPFIGADAASFVLLNRGKEGLALDLARATDRELFTALLRRADVIVEDWRSDFSRALGFDYEAVHALNPRAICLSVTGWGEKGPWADRPQSELTAQFAAEVTTSLGRPGEKPIRVGTEIASAYSGIFGFQAVCAALYNRGNGGPGQQIFVSLFGSLLFMRGTLWMAHSNPDGWYGFHLENYLYPPDLQRVAAFECRDGLVTFSARVGSREQLDLLLTKLGEDPAATGEVPDAVITPPGTPPAARGTPMAAAARAFWQKVLRDKDVISVCMAAQEAAGGGAFPLHDYETLLRSPQADAVQLTVEVDDPHRGRYRVVAAPWTFVSPTKRTPPPAPALDEHRDALLRELGLSAEATVRG